LDLKIIATFNTDIGKIDPALLRKGRMFYEYRFRSLKPDEGNNLLNFMGINRTITETMTLAEIFNAEDNHADNSFEERRIGFV
jgi:ATP-dependent 26S proteasome regulatory subunit